MQGSIVVNIDWSDFDNKDYVWIKRNDSKYQFLRTSLIEQVFPVLRKDDRDMLLDAMVKVVNFIYLKFSFFNNPDKKSELLWNQLRQNNLLDLKSFLTMLLPYISDNQNNDKKNNLRTLRELYLKKNERGQYEYTNSQYNRCIRYKENDKIIIIDRPYLKEYFLDHLELLMMSIEISANKLYINWVDVLPMTMTKYTATTLYRDTVTKILDIHDKVELIKNYIDPKPGLSYQDMYNTIFNHLYGEISNYKWLIYDLIINGNPVSYVSYLETKINLSTVWEKLLWSQLTDSQAEIFKYEWNNFVGSLNPNDNIVFYKYYIFFCQFHKNAKKLVRQNKLIPKAATDENEEEEDRNSVTPENLRFARAGMEHVPIEEIYLFFSIQFAAYKKTWYYYFTKIRGEKYLGNSDTDLSVKIYITPKNIYNYCKSMVKIVRKGKHTEIPRHWYTLTPDYIEMFLIRLLDINHSSNDWTDPKKPNWFTISGYLRVFYPRIKPSELMKANEVIHNLIRRQLVNIVFESLIYHGILCDYMPNQSITDNTVIETIIGTSDERAMNAHRRDEMKKQYFNSRLRPDYEENAYSFVTGTSYGDIKPIRDKTFPGLEKKYFDFLTSEQDWTFTYAMNWVSQINLYHHYINNRVIYITGSTGVGKSTEVPKLFMYCQKMLDLNPYGKIICSQPRVQPTVDTALWDSMNLGIPIKTYNELYDSKVFTANYMVQYKYKLEAHVDKNTDSYLKLVTDGTLIEELIASPFLTESSPDMALEDSTGNTVETDKTLNWAKKYLATNKYDMIIVDEAHEHNHNMDLILTLGRDIVYMNNSVKLVITSATMDDDEPIYRRYYRNINDNRAYPLSSFIQNQQHDRANMDRRVHISPPGATTRHAIKDVFLSKAESDLINNKNFVDFGIRKAIEVANSTTEKDMLLFMSGSADIKKAVPEINAATPPSIIALPFYSEMSEEQKNFIKGIDQTLKTYTRFKEDVLLEESAVTRRVPAGTYKRAVIIGTNLAEASVTFKSLKYVIDTGYAKVNVYDPLEGTEKMIIMPISQTSSDQRRGRVGRVAPGEVYYMYDKEKIRDNKTTYKIADINIKDFVIKLLKSDIRDTYIVTFNNDINNISNINIMLDPTTIQTANQLEPGQLPYDLLGNPRSYLDIIKSKYLFIPDESDITQYYTYYGKADSNAEYPTLASVLDNLESYLVNNHDDYNYQETLTFFSRAHTGYTDETLRDQELSFYVIHPEENIIKRNMYTGQIDRLKYNPAVMDNYYYYILKTNNVIVTDNMLTTEGDFSNIDYTNFYFLKFNLAMSDAKFQLLTLDIPYEPSDAIVNYTNITDETIRQQINKYYKALGKGDAERITTIKSKILANLENIQQMVSLDILMNTNNMLWYAFSIPHKIEKTVLAIMTLLFVVPDVTQWISVIKFNQARTASMRSKVVERTYGPNKLKNDINKFTNMYLNEKGDMYFLWMLWNNIERILNASGLLVLTEIGVDLQSRFENYKFMFYRGEKMLFDQYVIFDKLDKAGQLNVIDEFYNYVAAISINFKDLLKNSKIDSYLRIIAKDYMLSAEKIELFVVEYFGILFECNRRIWMYEYEVKNKLLETEETENLLEWANSTLNLPSINNNPNYELDAWDRFLETYLRAYSMNLIKNQGNYYLRIGKGVRMDPAYWSKKIKIRATVLAYGAEYLVYHTAAATIDNAVPVYLTPVKLEWMINLNPIYYYYYFDTENILYSLVDDVDVKNSINIINRTKENFNFKNLIAYLDQIDNPIISKIIRKDIMRTQSSSYY